MKFYILFSLLVTSLAAEPLTWTAHWIAAPQSSPTGFGVYHFRRTFDLPAVPSQFLVHVSADNRYQLFINGTRVGLGPARGDLFHWRYETVDLAFWLRPGRNVLAVVVWNWGSEHAPMAQITAQTAFLLQGDTGVASVVNTDKQWKVRQDSSYSLLPLNRAEIHYMYYVAAPGERVDGGQYPWGWEQPDFNDSAWPSAQAVANACSREWTKENVPQGDCYGPWMLMERPIPPLEERPQRFAQIREATGVAPGRFVNGTQPITIPPRTVARLLFDNGEVTTAYSELSVSGGRGATLSLRYAESLWIPGANDKGNRNEVAGKEMRGLRDVFIADGGKRMFRPLWWRAFRYVELTVETGEEALSLDDFRSTLTLYPFGKQGRFESDAPAWLPQVLKVGWWTNRLSSNETYQDAYYEQLQYVGDTRIEALVSLYESGDARLMRNALEQFDSTRNANSLTYSRGPSRLYQYTPTFSVLWIGMLHDYWRYVGDPELVRNMLPGVRLVLRWFAGHQREDGSLRELPYYNFIDTFRKWNPHALGSYELQLLEGYQWAAELESALGDASETAKDKEEAERMRRMIRARYWDGKRALFADDVEHTVFSQHANALAVLTGVTGGLEARTLMQRTLADTSLEQSSIYFRYYVYRAAIQAGLGDQYLNWLGDWRHLLDLGVTAWPESERVSSRSDCHGWGDHPNIEIYRTVLGIDSAAPGFARIRIEPHLGDLTWASCTVPHPKGKIQAVFRRQSNGSLSVSLELPVPGELVWHGKTQQLQAGEHHFVF